MSFKDKHPAFMEGEGRQRVRNAAIRRLRVAALLLALLIGGCAEDHPVSLPPDDQTDDTIPPRATPTVGPEIGWVSLEPRTRLPTSLEDPPETGWPGAGEEVRWQAHVHNRGPTILQGVRYAWHVDGGEVDNGTADLPPGETIFELDRAWRTNREEITFSVEMDSVAGVPSSDRLSVLSNALTIGFWVEQSIYDYMEAGAGIPPFERWARLQVDRWNRILDGWNGLQKDAGTVDEVIDRLRLDRITVLPTGSEYPRDLDTDLVWYFSQLVKDSRFLHDDSRISVVNDQTIVLHELLHQRGLVDLYAYEVYHGTTNGSKIDIVDPDGAPAAGTDRLPFLGERIGGHFLYRPEFANTLMGWDYIFPTRLSVHSIYGLNLFAGRRTPRLIDRSGNLLNPLARGNLYAAHVPDRTELKLETSSGEPLSNVAVDVFLDRGVQVYQDLYGEEPDLKLQADANGIAVLPSDPWKDPEWRKRKEPSVIILRARTAGDSTWGYAFVPVFDLNMAYISGDQDLAQIPVTIDLR